MGIQNLKNQHLTTGERILLSGTQQSPIGDKTIDKSIIDKSIALAKEVMLIEARAIEALGHRLDSHFSSAVSLILQCQGKVVVSGMGKSGHIANKIAATLASTGTPAFFMHPAEASHGDLGMLDQNDIVIALSYSGESDELLTILPMIKRIKAKLISITGDDQSTLARESLVHLNAFVAQEACPLGLAPTASTTAALALGDALALAVLDQRGFSAEDFARSHPSGSLGRKLLLRVRDIMRQDDAIPAVNSDAGLKQALLEMSRKGLGMTAVVNEQNIPIGIFTDGDLRRAFEQGVDIQTTSIQAVMHGNPLHIAPDQLAVDAVALMETKKVSALLVTDAHGKLIGALNMHDLLMAKVV
jgi:arabinose-5-phosphate isomerase